MLVLGPDSTVQEVEVGYKADLADMLPKKIERILDFEPGRDRIQLDEVDPISVFVKHEKNEDFSFSGLKTAVLYKIKGKNVGRAGPDLAESWEIDQADFR